MQELRAWLNKAYYLNGTAAYRLKLSLIFSGFVFVFLLLFKPFGIGQMGALLLPTALNFAAVTLVCMLLLNVGLPKFIPKFFSEEKWTVGKELLYSTINVVTIGFANALYSIVSGLDEASGKVVFVFMLYTICMAIFPITLSILYKEAKARKKYEASSITLTESIEHHVQTSSEKIVLPSQTMAEQLELPLEDLLFIVAADNYVEVHFKTGASVQKKLLRNPLKVYEELLNAKNCFWRCHKSYLVNLEQVERVSGNAQGFRLHISGTELSVPVSRSNNSLLKEKLQA